MDNNLIEDSKVVGSAVFAVFMDYAQIFNQVITLLISFCTLVYVANKAYRSLFPLAKKKKRRGR